MVSWELTDVRGKSGVTGPNELVFVSIVSKVLESMTIHGNYEYGLIII